MLKYKKINTFTRSPSLAQICSYVVVALDVIVYLVMIQSKFQDGIRQIVINVLFGCSVGGVLVATGVCSGIDPSDSIMVDCREGNGGKYAHRRELLYCDFCRAYVTESSRHCRECDRCVQGFDHHCMWINNCVGAKNYRAFGVMIGCTFFHLGVYLVAAILLTTENQWSSFLYFMVPCWIVMGVISVLWVLLLNLIILHIYLNYKGYTTYQFIVARREQERQEEEEKVMMRKRQEEEKVKVALEDQKLKLGKKRKFDGNKGAVGEESMHERIHVKAKQSNVSSDDSQGKLNKKQSEDNLKDDTLNQNSREVIKRVVFDGQQCTEKSVEVDSKLEEKKKLEEEEDNSSEDNVRISSFFTRNKSFNLLMSQEVAKPHKNMNASGLLTPVDPKAEKSKTARENREIKPKVQKSKTSQKKQ